MLANDDRVRDGKRLKQLMEPQYKFGGVRADLDAGFSFLKGSHVALTVDVLTHNES